MPDLTTEILADNPVVYYPLNETSGTQATNAAVKAKNHCINPSAEVDSNAWVGNWGGSTGTWDATVSNSGARSYKLVTTSGSSGQGLGVTTPSGLGLGGVTRYTRPGIYLKGNVGGEPIDVWARVNYTNGTSDNGGNNVATLTTSFEFYVVPELTINPAKTVDYITVFARTRTATATTYWADDAIIPISLAPIYNVVFFSGATPGCSWDGTANASTSSYNRHGTYTNGPLINQPGFTGGGNPSVKFDGTNDYVAIPGDAFNLADTFSIEGFGSTSAAGSIIGRSAEHIVRINASNKVELCKGATVIATSTAAITTARWHHIVVTKSGSTVVIYVDGASVAITAGTAQTFTASTAELRIAATASADYYNGSQQHVAIYPTALSAARVLAHYKSALPGSIRTTTATYTVTRATTGVAND